MAGRAVGAILALVAAIAFAGTLASSLPGGFGRAVPAWWDGHPRVAGKEIDRKEIHVALASAEGCNLGETVTCQPITIGELVKLGGLAELALVGFAMIVAVVLASSAWRMGDGRKQLATIARFAVALAGGGAAVLALLGPDIHASQAVDVPLGLGFALCGVGVLTTAVASVIAPRLLPEPLRLRTSAMNAARPAVDEPRFAGAVAAASYAPATPLPSAGNAPLLAAAPQLRPLYDHQGAVPLPAAPQLPSRPPTPVSRDALASIVALPTPAPMIVPVANEVADDDVIASEPAEARAEHSPSEPPRLRVPTINEVRADLPAQRPTPQPNAPPSASVRAKAASAAPPIRASPLRNSGPLSAPWASRVTGVPVVPATSVAPAVPIAPVAPVAPVRPSAPANPQRAGENPSPFAFGIPPPRPSSPSRPPAVTGKPSRPTIAHAVPPPPLPPPSDTDKSPTVAPALESADSAQRTEQHVAQSAEMVDGSDTGVDLQRASSNVNLSTGEQRTLLPNADDVRAQTEPSEPSQPAEPSEPPAATPGSTSASASDSPPPSAPAPATPLPSVLRSPAPIAVPLSTAPTSLPPPKVTKQVSGPTPACPQCEAPMAWVDEHLRFYCKQCRMYF